MYPVINTDFWAKENTSSKLQFSPEGTTSFPEKELTFFIPDWVSPAWVQKAQQKLRLLSDMSPKQERSCLHTSQEASSSERHQQP